jgi:hypothetical protein
MIRVLATVHQLAGCQALLCGGVVTMYMLTNVYTRSRHIFAHQRTSLTCRHGSILKVTRSQHQKLYRVKQRKTAFQELDIFTALLVSCESSGVSKSSSSQSN